MPEKVSPAGPSWLPANAPCPHFAAEYDPLSPEHAADPYPAYAHARQECPVFYSPVMRAWIVTRYEDVMTAARDTERFSSAEAIKSTEELPPEVQEVLKLGYLDVPGLVNNDPPAHTRVRKLANKGFLPKRIATMESQVRDVTHGLIDRFADAGRTDLVRRFATPLPLLVITGILGVPQRDIGQIRRWAEDYRASEAPSVPLQERLKYAHSTVALRLYLASRIEERRARPEDDLISDLVGAEVDGEKLSTPEILSVVFQLLHGGHETTISLIGSMVHLLLRHPDQWRAVREDPSLAGRVVEETLRRECPVAGLMRTTTEEVELGGVTLPRGARLQLMFASANHDESHFSAPERFDIFREDGTAEGKHLGFGKGRHACIGAPLARLEGRIALQALMERLPNLRLVPGQPPEYVLSTFSHGLARLAVEWDPA